MDRFYLTNGLLQNIMDRSDLDRIIKQIPEKLDDTAVGTVTNKN